MKRFLGIATIVLFLPLAAFAQNTVNFSTYQSAFKTFATDVANSLPLNADVGLNWSDAYIGQFPHLGAGATVGFSTIPYSAVDALATNIGINIASLIPSQALTYLKQYGIPFPAYTVEARIGGFILPFDIGVKAGYIGQKLPAAIMNLLQGINLNYLLVGADVRFDLVKDQGLLPGISVGAGFNMLRGAITLPAGGPIDITSFGVPTSSGTELYDLSMATPKLTFRWNTKVIDLKAQASKHLLIFTPYVGVGASKAFSTAGGGVQSAIEVSTPSDPTPHSPSPTEETNINAALGALGYPTIDFTNPGFYVTSTVGGWSFRAFGGLSVDLAILHLDLGVKYDFLGHNYGGSVGVRLSF